MILEKIEKSIFEKKSVHENAWQSTQLWKCQLLHEQLSITFKLKVLFYEIENRILNNTFFL